MDNTNLQKCRTCLAQTHKLIPLSAFSIASKNTLHISDIFMACAAIQIRSNDGFSQYACSECVISAEKAYLFKKQCECSDKIWKEQLKEMAQPVAALPSPKVHNENPEPVVRIQTPAHNEDEEERKTVEIFEVKTEQFTCKYCFTIFVDEAKLLRHEFAHTIQPKKPAVKEYVIYSCRDCSVDANTAEDFIEHCDALHKKSIEKLYYRCKLCAGDFAELSQLATHVERRHRILKMNPTVPVTKRQNLFTQYSSWPKMCNYCTMQLKSFKDRMVHLDQKHSDLKKFVCDKCGKKFFLNSNLRKHAETHEDVKTHMCQYCGRGFAKNSTLINHIRIHTGEKPFKCSTCNASFAQWASLRSHQSNHISEKNFECAECHRRFKTSNLLLSHSRTHAEGPKFTCHLCSKQLKSSKSLKGHLRTHSNERPRMCKVCGKRFSRRDNLKIHMRTHTGEKPHVCAICKKGFSQAHCLRSHHARYHKDDAAQV